MKLSLNLGAKVTVPAWAAGLVAFTSLACGALALQLSRVLFTVIRESDWEAQRMVTGVTTAVQSDSTEILVPDEMYLEDDFKEVYSYGALQTILFRKTPGGHTDWQWSFNGGMWYNTDDTQADHATLLDPPNLIFICRLHLQSIARRKSAALQAKLLGQPSSHLGGRYIPAPLDTSTTRRDLFEAPDTLCCPISSCVMTQPVVAPSGKSFDYGTLCEWVLRHGTDPTSNQPLSVHDLYPNLVLREQVERWLGGEDLGFEALSPLGAAPPPAGEPATAGTPAEASPDGAAGVVGGGQAGHQLQQQAAAPVEGAPSAVGGCGQPPATAAAGNGSSSSSISGVGSQPSSSQNPSSSWVSPTDGSLGASSSSSSSNNAWVGGDRAVGFAEASQAPCSSSSSREAIWGASEAPSRQGLAAVLRQGPHNSSRGSSNGAGAGVHGGAGAGASASAPVGSTSSSGQQRMGSSGIRPALAALPTPAMLQASQVLQL